MKISQITDICINKPLKTFANSKSMEFVCKKYRENNSKFITALSVGSIVAKDGYGCFIYVYQNEHNKNIPEDKRKFLSGLDIANGSLMILAQILAYMTISKKAVQSRIFNKVLGKYFNAENFSKIQKNMKNVPEFKKAFDKNKEDVEVAFTHFVTLLTTTILAKRVIVPYIATPLADLYKKKFEKKP